MCKPRNEHCEPVDDMISTWFDIQEAGLICRAIENQIIEYEYYIQHLPQEADAIEPLRETLQNLLADIYECKRWCEKWRERHDSN